MTAKALPIDLELKELIREAEGLHSAPGVAQSLLSLMTTQDFDIREVVSCLERDPALSIRLLRVLNSTRYGLRQPVKNLRQAVMLLGQRTLRLIILTFSVQEVFSRGPVKSLYTQYWQQSLTMAIVGQRFAARSETVCPHDGYMAGLMSHIGILLFAQTCSETYLPLFEAVRSGDELVEAEREAFGFDHAELGASLLSHWGLPEDLVTAVKNHHHDEADSLAGMVHTGDLLADVLWRPGTTSIEAARHWMNDCFGLGIDEFISLARQVGEEIRLEAEIYGITLENPVNSQVLLETARRNYFECAFAAAMDLDSLTSAFEDSNSQR